jgi:hypothetical protein
MLLLLLLLHSSVGDARMYASAIADRLRRQRMHAYACSSSERAFISTSSRADERACLDGGACIHTCMRIYNRVYVRDVLRFMHLIAD